ncbi:MAG: hypothetical protein HKN92_02255 [Chitinophagales bacterium]|nr:hypothetical protein [Chitinophagales bacterium]
MALITYLSDQLLKIEQEGFELDPWKGSTIKILDNAIGSGNEFSKTLSKLAYEEVVSYEELYPKRVRNLPASVQKFKSTLREIIDQIRTYESMSDSAKEEKITSNILGTLKFHLRGSQLEELKQATGIKNETDRKEALLGLIEKLDSDILQMILRDILSENPIGDKI